MSESLVTERNRESHPSGRIAMPWRDNSDERFRNALGSTRVVAPRQSWRCYRMHTDTGGHARSGSAFPASEKFRDCGQRQSREVAYVVGADPVLQRVLLDVKSFISPEVVSLGSVREFAQYSRND